MESQIKIAFLPECIRLFHFSLVTRNVKNTLKFRRSTRRYHGYVEADGKIATNKEFTPNFGNRMCISTAKTSGTFRRDYDTYIERITE